jgi:hypothetical protein
MEQTPTQVENWGRGREEISTVPENLNKNKAQEGLKI